ncbi:MAG: mechanosensitive ion channel [Proteobacteria bacterium]|nr:mechanosensitive ion channel [Pseudomonadota bacterium]
MTNNLPNSLHEILELGGVSIFLVTSIAAILASVFVRKTNMLFLGVQLILLLLSVDVSLRWSHPLFFRAVIEDFQAADRLVATALFMAVGFTLDMALMVFLWQGPLTRDSQQTFPKLLVAVVRILLYLVVILLILQFVYDKSITALATLSGAFALILGLSAQTTLGEMFAGIAIALSRPFNVGDWVKVGNLDEGRVVDMTWRLVRIENRDRNVINVPNRVVADSPIKNFSRPSGVSRISDVIYFAQSADPVVVQEILIEAIRKAKCVIAKPAPSALYRGAKDGVAEYAMRYYINDYKLKDDATENVWKSVVEHVTRANLQIELPRRQVEIWREIPPATPA